MKQSHLRSHLSRFVKLAVAYGGARLVTFSALFLPAALGSSLDSLGTLELLLVGGGLGSAFGPLGTQAAIMHERFSARRSNLFGAMAIALAVGTLIGAAASGTLGVYGLVAGGFLGGTSAVRRVVQHRLRVSDSTVPLVQSTALLVASYGLAVLVIQAAGFDLARVTPWVLCGASLIALIPVLGVHFDRALVGPPQIAAMLRFGLPIGLGSAGAWVVAAADRYVLLILENVDVVGTYGVIARFVMLYSGLTSTVIVWWQAESYRRGRAWTHRYINRYLGIAGIGAIVGAAIVSWPMMMVLERILDLSPQDLWPTITWLLISIVGYVMLTGIIAAYVTSSRVLPVGMAWATAAVINVGANFGLIPEFGIAGAACATALSIWVPAIGLYVLFRSTSASWARDV